MRILSPVPSSVVLLSSLGHLLKYYSWPSVVLLFFDDNFFVIRNFFATVYLHLRISEFSALKKIKMRMVGVGFILTSIRELSLKIEEEASSLLRLGGIN